MVMWKRNMFHGWMVVLGLVCIIIGLILIGASKNTLMSSGTATAVNGFTFLNNKMMSVGWALVLPVNQTDAKVAHIVSPVLQAGIVFAVILGPIFLGNALIWGAASMCFVPMKKM